MSNWVLIPEQNRTVDEMKARIELLADEIDANEEDNRFMQTEIDQLYAKIDKIERPVA